MRAYLYQRDLGDPDALEAARALAVEVQNPHLHGMLEAGAARRAGACYSAPEAIAEQDLVHRAGAGQDVAGQERARARPSRSRPHRPPAPAARRPPRPRPPARARRTRRTPRMPSRPDPGTPPPAGADPRTPTAPAPSWPGTAKDVPCAGTGTRSPPPPKRPAARSPGTHRRRPLAPTPPHHPPPRATRPPGTAPPPPPPPAAPLHQRHRHPDRPEPVHVVRRPVQRIDHPAQPRNRRPHPQLLAHERAPTASRKPGTPRSPARSPDPPRSPSRPGAPWPHRLRAVHPPARRPPQPAPPTVPPTASPPGPSAHDIRYTAATPPNGGRHAGRSTSGWLTLPWLGR